MLHLCLCQTFAIICPFLFLSTKKGPAKRPPLWQLVQFGESHFWAIQLLIGERNPKSHCSPPPPAKYCWVTIPSYNSFFVWLSYLWICMHAACIFDMYRGNKLAVLSSVSWLGLVLPIQMTGGSKPVAEAWKTCVHVKRSYSWLAPRGPNRSEGHVFLVDGSYGSCGLMTLRQQFKISRDQISRLKSLITR